MKSDTQWSLLWLAGILLLGLWDVLFLNRPAVESLATAVVNSLLGGCIAVAGAFAIGWCLGVSLHLLDTWQSRAAKYTMTFLINLVRSIPQILGVLAGYAVLTQLIRTESILNRAGQILWMAASVSMVLAPEVVDLVTERIRYYVRHDFVPALRCCGVSEARIVNVEILWRNSRSHLLHGAISLFGSALFLQCSVDFIVSVGLATDVSLANFPVTLGGLLARLDSKQDILAVGKVFGDPSYLPVLLVRHLQGISTAFVIVFSLLCTHKVANAYVRRKDL